MRSAKHCKEQGQWSWGGGNAKNTCTKKRKQFNDASPFRQRAEHDPSRISIVYASVCLTRIGNRLFIFFPLCLGFQATIQKEEPPERTTKGISRWNRWNSFRRDDFRSRFPSSSSSTYASSLFRCRINGAEIRVGLYIGSLVLPVPSISSAASGRGIIKENIF